MPAGTAWQLLGAGEAHAPRGPGLPARVARCRGGRRGLGSWVGGWVELAAGTKGEAPGGPPPGVRPRCCQPLLPWRALGTLALAPTWGLDGHVPGGSPGRSVGSC